MERRVLRDFCLGCGGILTPSSTKLPSLLLSVASGGRENDKSITII